MLKRAKKLGKIGGSHEMNVKVSESILMIKRAKEGVVMTFKVSK